MTKVDRNKIYIKCNNRCAYCGEHIDFKAMQIDHIIPQSEYVTYVKNKFRIPVFLTHLTELDMNHPDNLLPTCRVCNKWKSCFTLELFRSEVQEQIKRLNDYSSNYRMAKKYGLVEEKAKPVKFYFESIEIY